MEDEKAESYKKPLKKKIENKNKQLNHQYQHLHREGRRSLIDDQIGVQPQQNLAAITISIYRNNHEAEEEINEGEANKYLAHVRNNPTIEGGVQTA